MACIFQAATFQVQNEEFDGYIYIGPEPSFKNMGMYLSARGGVIRVDVVLQSRGKRGGIWVREILRWGESLVRGDREFKILL